MYYVITFDQKKLVTISFRISSLFNGLHHSVVLCLILYWTIDDGNLKWLTMMAAVLGIACVVDFILFQYFTNRVEGKNLTFQIFSFIFTLLHVPKFQSLILSCQFTVKRTPRLTLVHLTLPHRNRFTKHSGEVQSEAPKKWAEVLRASFKLRHYCAREIALYYTLYSCCWRFILDAGIPLCV